MTVLFLTESAPRIDHRRLVLVERTAQLRWHGVSPLVDDSRFLAPRRASYSAGGARRSWDLVESMPSVAVLLYHRERRAALLVRQFRPPVYAAAAARAREGAPPPPLDAGFTYELCAGLRDKAGLSAEAVAIEEVRTVFILSHEGCNVHHESFLTRILMTGARGGGL